MSQANVSETDVLKDGQAKLSNESCQVCHSPPAVHGGRCRRCKRRGRRITGGGLAIGSISGIAMWALLYVLGGAASALAWASTGESPSLLLGCYGALAAGFALYVGAFVAVRADGLTDTEMGVLSGITMAGMANITLTAVAMALQQGLFAQATGPWASLLAVGQAAIGFGRPAAATLASMAAVMLLSLATGALGGRSGARFGCNDTSADGAGAARSVR